MPMQPVALTGDGMSYSDPKDRVYLAVKYEDKEEAKSFGAKWDKIGKQWYIEKWNITGNPGIHRWIRDPRIKWEAKDAHIRAKRNGKHQPQSGRIKTPPVITTAADSASQPAIPHISSAMDKNYAQLGTTEEIFTGTPYTNAVAWVQILIRQMQSGGTFLQGPPGMLATLQGLTQSASSPSPPTEDQGECQCPPWKDCEHTPSPIGVPGTAPVGPQAAPSISPGPDQPLPPASALRPLGKQRSLGIRLPD